MVVCEGHSYHKVSQTILFYWGIHLESRVYALNEICCKTPINDDRGSVLWVRITDLWKLKHIRETKAYWHDNRKVALKNRTTHVLFDLKCQRNYQLNDPDTNIELCE